MDGDEYTAWVAKHVVLFGAGQGVEDAMLSREWRAALCGALGATVADLYACTQAALADPRTANWPNEHLDAIKRHLPAVQAKRRPKPPTYDERRGVCQECGNSGWVIVPHPRFVIDGEWRPERHTEAGDPRYATAAVYCRCELGRGFNAKAGERPAMTLERYELECDAAWREHLAERDAAERAVAAARGVGVRTPGEVVKGLAAGTRF